MPGLASAALACSSTDGVDPIPDASPDRFLVVEAGAGPTPGDASADVFATPDITAPGVLGDVKASATSHVSIDLSFVATGDDGANGTADHYEIRYSTEPFAGEVDFLTASAVPSPVPFGAGLTQTVTVANLVPETKYYFAVRAIDDAGNKGPISDTASVTTMARARFLVSEVAPQNRGESVSCGGSVCPEGWDFVELVATQAGSARDIEIRQAGGFLHKLAAFEVVVGDRIVVHLGGLPSGGTQEDATKSATASTEPFASPSAYDVYANASGLTATNNVVSVLDGVSVVDAVAYSNRAIDASASAMEAFASAQGASAWEFGQAPVDGGDDCATLLEVVNASSSAPPCGGFPGFMGPGQSMQRNATVDTNTRLDFFVAPQTRGAANATFCPVEPAAAVAITEVNPNLGTEDLVELQVTQSGPLRGFELRRDPTSMGTGGGGTLLATLPSICAAAGDVVVIHLTPSADPTTSETAAKDEHPSATYAQNYNGAWDVRGGNNSLPFTASTAMAVLTVRDPSGAYIEAAAFSNGTAAVTATYRDALAFAQSLGLWLPADCGGVTCTDASTPTAQSVSAIWAGVEGTPGGTSCRRATLPSASTAASFAVGVSSFGTAN